MRKWLWLLVCVPVLAFGQVNPGVVIVGTAPSGSCPQGVPGQMVNSTGVIWTCQNIVAGIGTWTQETGGGGGGGNVSNSGTPLIHQTAVWVDATHVKGIANGTTGQFWGANTGADPGWQTVSAGSKTITLLNAVNQGTGATGGTAGVSASCSYPNSLYTAYAQKGDGTHPQLGMAEFATAGSLTAATRVDCAFTMPSNYTANGTITISGLAGCTVGSTAVTFALNWADFTTGPSLAPTLSSDFTASITPATVASLTAFSVALTTPTINPGDFVSISFRVSVDGSGCAPVIPQLIASY